MSKLIKIGVFLEGSPKMGGGFYQSLKSSLLLSKVKDYNSDIEIIITDKSTETYFNNINLRTVLFKPNKIYKYYSELFEIDAAKQLLNKLKLKHSFTSFIKKNKYDLVVFLGPSLMAKYCADISFIFNIWDLDHKKNTQFPEHNLNYNYEKKEKLLNEVIYRAFRIIVPHHANKIDFENLYKVPAEQIVNQNLIPILPEVFLEKKKNLDYKKIFDELSLPKDKKIIFYPAQFWAHKNHKYIIDTVQILKKENIQDYFFVFCGTDKGNLSYIKNEISDKKLESNFKILPFIDDDNLISMYLNCDAVVMPTYCGPTNLPIYESFYFKKIIFYTKGLIPNDDINSRLIQIDINTPKDFYDKLIILSDKEKLNNMVNDNHEFYQKICNEEIFIMNYKKIFDDFMYLFKRWN